MKNIYKINLGFFLILTLQAFSAEPIQNILAERELPPFNPNIQRKITVSTDGGLNPCLSVKRTEGFLYREWRYLTPETPSNKIFVFSKAYFLSDYSFLILSKELPILSSEEIACKRDSSEKDYYQIGLFNLKGKNITFKHRAELKSDEQAQCNFQRYIRLMSKEQNPPLNSESEVL